MSMMPTLPACLLASSLAGFCANATAVTLTPTSDKTTPIATPSRTGTQELPNQEVKTLMHRLFASLQIVYRASLTLDDASAPAADKAVEAAFNELSSNAEAIAQHRGRDELFPILAASLHKDAELARSWYKQGRMREASFTVQHMVDDCVSCHTRTQQQRSFPLALLTPDDEKKLSPFDLAHLKVATRQFDEAEGLLTKLLREPVTPKQDLFYQDARATVAMVDYLKLMVRVRQDLVKAGALVKELQPTAATPSYKKALATWSADLQKANAEGLLKRPPSLALAKGELARAESAPSAAVHGSSLIQYLLASAILQELVKAPASDPATRAEAYRLLATTEDHLQASFWLSEAQNYWQAAIVTLPHSAIAMQAYRELSEAITQGYSGSSGTHIPKQVTAWLQDLRQLADRPTAQR